MCLLDIPNCDIFTYADDTALLIDGANWDEVKVNAERALKIVGNWLSVNLLTLNIDKSKIVPFSIRSNTSMPISCEILAHSCNSMIASNCRCKPISRSEGVKYLGIQLDSKLNWKLQIATLTSRIRRLIYIFKTLRHSLSTDTIKMVYLALCQSLLSYCVPVWGGAAKTFLIDLERAQRAVLKVILRKPIRFPTDKLYDVASVLSVRQLYVLRSILRKHPQVPSHADPRKRRNRNICSVEAHKTKFSTRHFYIASSILYNKINKELQIYSQNHYEVKTKVMKWLQKLSYDDTESLLI